MQLSFAFLMFLASVLPLYFVLPWRLRQGLLLVASIVFYAFAGWQGLVVLLGLTLVTYAGGRYIGRVLTRQNETLAARRADGSWDKPARKAFRDGQQRRIRRLMALFVALDVGCLLMFKLSVPVRLGAADAWLLPMGLSYVTLSAVGYLIDVSRGHVAAERSVLRFGLAMFYFPQMWQGPIWRYGELSDSLFAPHAFDPYRARTGLLRALWGSFKKLVVADTAAIAVRSILECQVSLGGAGMWALVILYTVRIYADFTGGMDICLGISHLLGITLPENFDRPFAAPSLKEYWRRWHRTMGRWFGDYVFYPLSVSRPACRLSDWGRRLPRRSGGKYLPLIFCMLATWLATGLWHGASWNFVLWGLFNGAFLLLSQGLSPVRRYCRERLPRLSQSRAWYVACCGGTVFLAGLLRTLDLNTRASVTLRLWGQMLAPGTLARLADGELWRSLGLDTAQWWLLLVGVALMAVVGHLTPRLGENKPSLYERVAARPMLSALVLALGAVTVVVFGAYGLGYDATAFIYGGF